MRKHLRTRNCVVWTLEGLLEVTRTIKRLRGHQSGSTQNAFLACSTEIVLPGCDITNAALMILTLRIFANANCTRQISRLHRSPYSPQSFSSESRRSFSKGLLGVLNVFRSVKLLQNGDESYVSTESTSCTISKWAMKGLTESYYRRSYHAITRLFKHHATR